MSNADRVSRGDALYREVFDFKGPISYLPYVVAYKFAPPTARTGRLVMFVILSLWAAAMFEVARRISGRRMLAVIVALWVPLQIWQAWTYAYQDFIAQFLLVLGVLAALVSFEGDRRTASARRRAILGLAASGFCCALALWTSLAQGISALVSLGIAIVLVARISVGPGAAWRAAGYFGAGVATGTLGVCAWLASMGALRTGLQAMLVFPFAHYRGAANATTYAYDAPFYASLWTDSAWVSVAARTILGATESVPLIAVAVAFAVVGWLIGLLVLRSSRSRWDSESLARVVVPASLAATAIPVLLNQTRSDICHLGFIEGGCVVALLAIFSWRARETTHQTRREQVTERIVVIARAGLAAGLAGTLVIAGAFYVHTLRAKPAGYVDLDAEGLVAYEGDFIAARTRPQDRVFVTSYGGWQYLYSRRDNATSFAFLIDDPYSDEQWPVAARQVIANRPRLLLVPESDFRKLCGLDARIGSMYFGFDGNYMLDDRGDGPPFPLPSSWEFTGDGAGDGGAGLFRVSLRNDAGSARLLAHSAARDIDMRAAIHGDLVSVFDGKVSYVGKLSQDGTRMEGTQFVADGTRYAFAGRLLKE